MNIKKAILTGLLLWTLIFFEVSVLMFGFNLKAGMLYYTLHYVISAIFVTICAMIYFRRKTTKTGLKEGLLLGVIFVVVGIILDAVITIPLFIKSYTFFNDPYLWLSYLEGILLTSIIGLVKKEK